MNKTETKPVTEAHPATSAATVAVPPLPKDRLEGLKENWRTDILSGFILFLIALPLSLAIAIASGMPPMAGIIAAIVGGMFVSQVSGSYVVINGPAAGLITVIAGSVARLGGGEEGQHATLAAVAVTGVILFILGKLKAGSLGDFFPLSVVHGMLASIGIIIMVKQFFIMIGSKAPSPEIVDSIIRFPEGVAKMNPDLAIIGGVSLAILVVHALIKNKAIKRVPIALFVVVVAVVIGQVFGLSHEHHYMFNGSDYVIDPAKCLVLIPNNPFSAITFPDFSKVASGAFWLSVLTITFVQGLETLLSCAAVDKLDPYKRKADLSKDVAGVGAGTAISGMIGGIAMIAEIVRSTANVAAGARTRWSNFFHGTFMLIFILVGVQLIDLVPTAALAAILVVTGFRLASPKTFKETFAIGPDQLLFFVVTIIATLKTDLLIGVATGIFTKFVVHLLSGAPPAVLFKADATVTNEGDKYKVVVRKAAIFSNYISIKNKLKAIPAGKDITVDLRDCKLVDHSVMERLHLFEMDYTAAGGHMHITGLENHTAASSHPLATRKLKKA
jgi:MFS superfamily sulfate permease-like transporter